MNRGGRMLALVLCGLVVLATGSHATSQRPIGDTRVFVHVPEPGMPEGIAVRGGLVYVGTHVSIRGNAGAGPSKIFVHDLQSGKRRGAVTIKGQNRDETHGILGMAFDVSGDLFVLDRNPPRMLRIDLSASPPKQTTHATFPDLAPCHSSDAPCSPTIIDAAPFPDYFAFDPAGNAYVTDLEQATIFVAPPKGGRAKIFFADARLDSVFGPNAIAVDSSRKRLYFAMTGSIQPTEPTQGLIYTLPLKPRPAADDLEVFFKYLEPATGPDGIAFGRSGKLYVALAGSNQVSILNPDGSEEMRFPSAAENSQQEIPYDLPASIAFDGTGSLLVTNQSFFAANPENWVVFDVFVDDVALPLIEPRIP